MEETFKIAQRLTQLREGLDINAAELCRQTGLAENQWSQYESGKRPITLAAAVKLRKKYGVPLDWIYFGDESCLPLHLARLMRIAA